MEHGFYAESRREASVNLGKLPAATGATHDFVTVPQRFNVGPTMPVPIVFRSDGADVRTCVLLTREAEGQIASIHHRMLVVLDPAQ